MADQEEKFDRFKPAKPKVPGAEAKPVAPPPAPPPKKKIPLPLLAGGGAVVLLLIIFTIWWGLQSEPEPAPRVATPPAQSATPASTVPGSPAATTSPMAIPIGPGEIATVQEFSKPWAAKKFVFRKPLVNERVNAIVVRLPVGSPRNASGYWAFATGLPGQPCELEFITDLARLAQEFDFRASHPMAADACTRRVYNPLGMDEVAGALIRGEVVSGPSGRPPLAILVRVEGNAIIAAQIE
jgi:hypothetical protein